VLAFALAALVAAPAAHGYTFGAPAVSALGPEVTVFDYSAAARCSTDDIPDQPARAFRNAAGEVVLIDTHHVVRRFVGTSLASVTRQCPTIMSSGVKRDPAMYDDREWLAATYTHNGTTIYGLIHAEYQGWQGDPGCGTSFEQRKKCWYNAITLTRSDNGGATFTHAVPPAHYVAGPPYTYQAGMGPIGFFQPSNIVRARDGFFYVLVHVEGGTGVQPTGSCLWRTSDLSDPGSWRAWGGSGFTVRFRDPYAVSYPPAEGVCAVVARNQIGTRSESLTWSSYFKKWMLVGSGLNADGVSGPGFYYHTSDDLINWTRGKLLMQGPLPWANDCNGEVLRDPSLLDDDGESRNFETIGQRPYLFFTRFHLDGCAWSLDRDLIRIPLEFSNRQPGGPVAVLNTSPRAPRTGQTVTFDAGGSHDDGSIVRYVWDLDGDGAFEVSSGTDPSVTKAYGVEGKVTVTLRVCDNDGKATDETAVLDVTGATVGVPPAQDGPTSAVCPAPGGGSPGGDPPSDPPATGLPGAGPAGGPAGGDGGQGSAASGAPAAATVAPPAGRVRVVGKPRMGRDGRIALSVRVPTAGRLTVRGGGRRPAVRTARRNASRARKLKVLVRPSRAGRALLRKRARARVKLALVFRPVAGRPQRSTVGLTLRRAAAPRR
jgi:hypothetical protein